MRLTYELLMKRGACVAQRDEFLSIFPDGCVPNVANLTALANHEFVNEEYNQCTDPACWCHSTKLDVVWLECLISDAARTEYDAFLRSNRLQEVGCDSPRFELKVAALARALLDSEEE